MSMGLLWRTVQRYELDASRKEILDALAEDVIFIRPISSLHRVDTKARTYVDPRSDAWILWRPDAHGVIRARMRVTEQDGRTQIELQLPRWRSVLVWGSIAAAGIATAVAAPEGLPLILLVAIGAAVRSRVASPTVVLAREVHRVLAPLETRAALGPYRGDANA
jgi:hypothetical protein